MIHGLYLEELDRSPSFLNNAQFPIFERLRAEDPIHSMRTLRPLLVHYKIQRHHGDRQRLPVSPQSQDYPHGTAI